MLRQRVGYYYNDINNDENSKTICIVTVCIYALTLLSAIILLIINIS